MGRNGRPKGHGDRSDLAIANHPLPFRLPAPQDVVPDLGGSLSRAHGMFDQWVCFQQKPGPREVGILGTLLVHRVVLPYRTGALVPRFVLFLAKVAQHATELFVFGQFVPETNFTVKVKGTRRHEVRARAGAMVRLLVTKALEDRDVEAAILLIAPDPSTLDPCGIFPWGKSEKLAFIAERLHALYQVIKKRRKR